MVRLSVSYPSGTGNTFDMAYYCTSTSFGSETVGCCAERGIHGGSYCWGYCWHAAAVCGCRTFVLRIIGHIREGLSADFPSIGNRHSQLHKHEIHHSDQRVKL